MVIDWHSLTGIQMNTKTQRRKRTINANYRKLLTVLHCKVRWKRSTCYKTSAVVKKLSGFTALHFFNDSVNQLCVIYLERKN